MENAYDCEAACRIGSRKSEGSIAAGLYDILRKMVHMNAENMAVESFAADTLGQAVMNRMLKAALPPNQSIERYRNDYETL